MGEMYSIPRGSCFDGMDVTLREKWVAFQTETEPIIAFVSRKILEPLIVSF